MAKLDYKVQITAAVAGRKEVQQLEAALSGLGRTKNISLDGITKSAPGIAGVAKTVAGITAALLAAKSAADALGAAFKDGILANSKKEQDLLGLKAVVASLYEVRDAQGEILSGQQKLAAAGQLATDVYNKAQAKALSSAASFQEVLESTQAVLSAGGGVEGFTTDTAVDIAAKITDAAKTFGLAQDQLRSEINALISGDITNDATIAKNLNITSEQIKAARDAGTLVDFLNQKLEVFGQLSNETGATFDAQFSNATSLLERFNQEAAAPAFKALTDGLAGAMKGILDDTGEFSSEFQGVQEIIERIYSTIADGLVSAIQSVIEVVREISAAYDQQDSQLREFVSLFGVSVGAIGEVFSALGDVIGSIIGAGTEMNVFNLFLVGASTLVAGLADGIRVVGNAIKVVGGFVLEALVAPIELLLKGLSAAASLAGADDLAAKITAANQSLVAGVKSIRANGQKGLADFAKDVQDGNSVLQQTLGKVAAARADAQNAIVRGPKEVSTGTSDKPTASGVKPNGGVDSGKAAKAAADRAAKEAQAFAKAQADLNALRLDLDERYAQETLNRQKVALDADIELRKISYKSYLQQRFELEKAGVDREAQLFVEQRQLVEQELESATATGDRTLATRLQGEIEKLNFEIERANGQKLQLQTELELDIDKFNRDIADLKVSLTAEILTAQGKPLEAGLAELQQKTAKLLQSDEVRGNPELEGAVNAAAALKENQLRVDEQQRLVQLAKNDLSISERDIQAQLTSGALGQLDAEKQLKVLREETLSGLQDQLSILQQLAAANPDNQELAQGVRELQVELKQLQNTANEVAIDINRRFADEVGTQFDNLIKRTSDFKDVLRDLFSFIVKEIASRNLKGLSDQIFGKLTGGGGGGVGGFIANFDLGKLLGFNTGGYVSGPGTPTSDSILARLSNGEFVVKAASVQQIGVQNLDYLNKFGRLPKFNTGGLVGASPAQSGQGGGGGAVRIVNVIDTAMIADAMDSSAGEKVIRNTISRNAAAFKQLLK